MRRGVLGLSVMTVVLLAGCDRGDTDPKSEREVAVEAAKLIKPRPGQYSVAVKVIDFQVPGMTAAQAEKFKGMFAGTGQERSFCLTQAEADKGFKEFTRKSAQGDCTYDKFEANGGKLDAKLTCKTGKDMTSTVEMAGTVGAEGSDMRMKMQQNGAGMDVKTATRMDMQMISKRVGDCAA